MAGTDEVKILITAEDKASGVLNNVGRSATSLAGVLGPLAKVAGVAVVGGLALLGKSAISAAADYEQSQIAFETMLGSAEKAEGFLAELTEFAKSTPFELTGLQDAAKSLLAYGIEQKKVLPDLKALGDIAAGVGMDKLPNLILAFGQVSAKGKLAGDDLRQFTAAGIPLLAQLGTQLGKSTAEIQEMVTAGEIGFPMVEQALMSLTSTGGRFENLMDKQAESFLGVISNIKDTFGILMRDIGNQFLPLAKDIATGFMENLPAIKDVIFSVITALISFAKETINLAKSINEALKPTFELLWIVIQENLLPSFQSLWDAIKNGLWPALQELWVTLQPFIPLLEMFAKVMAIAVVGAILIVVKVLTDLTTAAVKFWTEYTKVVTFIYDSVITAWKNFENQIIAVVNAFKAIIEFAQKAKDAVTGYSKSGASLNPFSSSFKIPGINDGIVQNGKVITTHPDDFIIATKNPGSLGMAGGGGVVINITGTFMSESAAMEMADKMIDGLKMQMRI